MLENGKKSDSEVIFTSGGTEACNQLILGFLSELTTLAKHPAHIISSSIEHPAILECLKLLESSGWEISYIDPEPSGIVDPKKFLSELRTSTALVNLMLVNNETGALQPVEELAASLRGSNYSGPIVSDCTQAVSKINFSVADLFEAGVTAVAVSAHKLGALSGIGAIVVSKSGKSLCYPYYPLLRGGPQEKRFRGGTENLLASICFGVVCDELLESLSKEIERKTNCKNLLLAEIKSRTAYAECITPERSNSNTLMIRFPEVRGDDLVVALDLNGVAASTGSACSSGRQEVSHVLKSMGLSKESAKEVIRLSLDWDINEEQVISAAEIISKCVEDARN